MFVLSGLRTAGYLRGWVGQKARLRTPSCVKTTAESHEGALFASGPRRCPLSSNSIGVTSQLD